MAKSDPCPKCGVNMNMVGKAHRCVPGRRTATPSAKAVAVTRAVARKVVAASERAAVKSSEPASPVTKARGRPAGPKRVPVLLELEPELLARLDRYHAGSELPSRQATIRFLLDGALK